MGYFFVRKKDIENKVIKVTGSEFRHIKNVLRVRIGDRLIFTTGDGDEYHSVISSVGNKYIKAQIGRITRKTNEPLEFIAIAIAPPKAQRMDWFVEKATELGASEIIPVLTKRSVVVPGTSKVNRWRRIAISAIKQAERSILPEIKDLTSFEDFLSLSMEFPIRFIAYEKEDKKNFKTYLSGKKNKKIIVLIGPEGGFDDEEVELAQSKGFIPVTLGVTKLRTETAGIVALSRILANIG